MASVAPNLLSEGKTAPGGVSHAPRGRVVRAVRDWIAGGILQQGDRIPAERVLAGQFGVSRDTVRAAMEQLETEQLLQRTETGARTVAPLAGKVNASFPDTVAVVTTLESRTGGSTLKAPGWESWLGTGVMQALYSAGLNTLVLHPDHVKPERLLSSRLHGMIMLHQPAGQQGANVLQALAQARIPTVVYGDADEFPAYDTVYSDQQAGAEKLTSWLIQRGCKRILRLWGHLGEPYPTWLKQRDVGHERVMQSHGLEVLPVVTCPPGAGVWPSTAAAFDLNVRYVAGFLVEYLAGPQSVNAIMTASDGPADMIAGACCLYSKTPGRDVLVTGYDDYWADTPSRPFAPAPPAATVDKKNAEIGRELVQLLLDRSAGRLPAEPQRRLVCPRLVIPSPLLCSS